MDLILNCTSFHIKHLNHFMFNIKYNTDGENLGGLNERADLIEDNKDI